MVVSLLLTNCHANSLLLTCFQFTKLNPMQPATYHTTSRFINPIISTASTGSHRDLFDQSKEITQNLYGRSAPPSHQTVKLLTAATVGATLLFLSGLTLTGTVIALIMATPVLVLFSPILVPAGIVMLLIAAGFVFSGGCGMAAMTVMAWLYNYVSNYAAAKQRANAYGQFVMLDI